jgi:hypothetical protein
MSGTARFGKVHLAVHSETTVRGISLGLPMTATSKPETSNNEQTKMRTTKISNNDMNKRSSSTLMKGKLPLILMSLLMVPLV